MKPLIGAAITGGVVIGVLLLVRRASARSVLPDPPPQTYGETTRIALAVPAGWRRITNAEALPELASQANLLRSSSGFTSMQYGSLAPFVASDGKTYATWVEQHYHEPGGAAKPWGFHHGVTLLAAT